MSARLSSLPLTSIPQPQWGLERRTRNVQIGNKDDREKCAVIRMLYVLRVGIGAASILFEIGIDVERLAGVYSVGRS